MSYIINKQINAFIYTEMRDYLINSPSSIKYSIFF